MDIVVLIARILIAQLYIGSGFAHLRYADMMTGMSASRGVPAARLAVVGSGIWIIVAGVMIALGIWIDLAGLLVASFNVAAAFLVNHFWTDPQDQRMQFQVNFNKDLALAGLGLLLFGLFAGVGENVGLMITGPLFSL